MRISSSTTGLYPVPVRATRNPVAVANGTDAASVPTGDQARRQLVPTTARISSSDSSGAQPTASQHAQQTNLEMLDAVGLARGYSDVDGLNVTGLNTVGLTTQFNAALDSHSAQHAAQRGAAEYAQVAAQEQRDELVALLGIDVFA